jgi:hypothetical protein
MKESMRAGIYSNSELAINKKTGSENVSYREHIL